MSGTNISSEHSDSLRSVQKMGRTVLYEELAEYYYLFSRRKALVDSTVFRERDYHIGNMILLTMYFDVVFVQTASLFNTTDPFIRKVVQHVIGHQKFRQMIACGVLKIVGWGGNAPSEMFGSAKSFAIDSSPPNADEQYYSALAELFTPNEVVYRSSQRPDDGIAENFRRRLEQTTIIRNASEYTEVKNALDSSLERTGQLVAISFNPEIGRLQLSSETLDAISVSFVQSWYDNLEIEIPGVVTYAPMSNPIYIDHKMHLSKKSIRTFLYSPQIFASFLRGYISARDFNKIIKMPYAELDKVKNGDWSRFANAYHQSVALVSENIGHLNYNEDSKTLFGDVERWSSTLSEIIDGGPNNMDVNAFMESLALLSGVIFSVPILAPLFKVVELVVGKDVNKLYEFFHRHASSEVSPFVSKLIKHFDLQGIRT